jgi:hypothetical protein
MASTLEAIEQCASRSERADLMHAVNALFDLLVECRR